MKIKFILILLLLGVMDLAISQINNPFDLQRNDSLVPPSSQLSQDSLIAKDEVKLEGDNPFSVSHIPIRKNQYEQIEQLTVKDRGAKENISISYLPLWLVVFSLCLLAYILIKKKNHIFILIRSIFNNNILRMTAYEENAGLSLVYISGYFLFVVNIAMFLYLVSEKAFGIYSEWGYFMILLLCLTFLWGKHIVLALISKLYGFDKEAMIYSFTIISLYNLLALVFLTINIILLFGPDNWIRVLAMAGVFLFIVFLISRYYKGLGIARKYLNDNIFHFFLYFCAFEFSPWLIVYSLLRDFI